MAISWLVALENLQAQFSGLAEVENLIAKDNQWVDEITTEAAALFKKDEATGNETEENKENDDLNTLAVAPVLLPQTPRVKIYSTFLKISRFKFEFFKLLGDKRQRGKIKSEFFVLKTKLYSDFDGNLSHF